MISYEFKIIFVNNVLLKSIVLKIKNPLYLLEKGWRNLSQKGLHSILYTSHTSQELSRILGAQSPIWSSFRTYALIYNTVSAVRTVLDVKADAAANVRFIVRDLDTNEIILFNSGNKIADKLYRLLANPNPLESTKEFFRADQIYHDTFGKSFIYASVPAGFENRVSIDSIDTLTSLPTHFVRTYYTGKYFDTLTVNDIISKYEFFDGLLRKEFNPNTILQRSNVSMNVPNISRNGDISANELSKLFSLNKEISNFIISLESRNVIGKKRGALGIFSSAMKVGGDILPLSDKLSIDVDAAFEKYGTLEHQNMFVHTKAPLNFSRTAMSTKDLMLFEESHQTMIATAHAYGVPDVLVRLDTKQATFENQKEGEKILYHRTVIPETIDKTNDLGLFMKLPDFKLKLEASFAHVEVLQSNKKDEAETSKTISETSESLFLAGVYTYNEWLSSINLPPMEGDTGNKRIFDLEDREIAIILGQMKQDESQNE